MGLFSNGGALGGTFAFTFFFLGIAYLMQISRSKEGATLAQMDRNQMILRSLQPGWTWASEMFLMSGVNYSEPALTAAMALFRLAHALLAAIILACLFDPWDIVKDHVDPLIDDISKLKKRYDYKFGGSNRILVTCVIMLSLFDATMIQYLPWKGPNPFFVESGGFPVLSVMQWCVGVKIVQSAVLISCVVAFMGAKANVGDPAMEPQGIALFVLNIIVNVAGILVWAYILLYKDVSLRSVDGEIKKLEQKQLGDFDDSNGLSIDDMGSFGDLYGDAEAANSSSSFENPMMSEKELSNSMSLSSTTAEHSASLSERFSDDKDGNDKRDDDYDPFGDNRPKVGVGSGGSATSRKLEDDADPFNNADFGGDGTWNDDSDADSVDGDNQAKLSGGGGNGNDTEMSGLA